MRAAAAAIQGPRSKAPPHHCRTPRTVLPLADLGLDGISCNTGIGGTALNSSSGIFPSSFELIVALKFEAFVVLIINVEMTTLITIKMTYSLSLVVLL